MSNKVNTIISVDDLLSIADIDVSTLPKEKPKRGPKRLQSESVEKHVRNYIQANNIIAGNACVPFRVIYDHYLQWVPKDYRAVTDIGFGRELKKYFKKSNVEGIFTYKLDPTTFGLPKDYLVTRDTRFFKNSTSKYKSNPYKGVHFLFGFYVARLATEDGYNHYLGKYKEPAEAAEAYDMEIIRYYTDDEAKTKINFKDRIEFYKAKINSEKEKAKQI